MESAIQGYATPREAFTAAHTPHPSSTAAVGIARKVQKWCRRKWQGSHAPVGHTDLWEQLLQAVEPQGGIMQCLHVPLHVGIHRNKQANKMMDMGLGQWRSSKAQTTHLAVANLLMQHRRLR